MNESKPNSKPGPIVFDQAKARQTIYSILMGLTLKSFLEHVAVLYKKDVFFYNLPTAIYCVILLCFLINCFRYLFALAQFANMTNDDYLPQDGDWKFGKMRSNLCKVFVLNSGVISLLGFGLSVFYIFPDSDVHELDSPTLHDLIMVFIDTFLCLNVLCLVTLFVYRKTKREDVPGISAVDLRVWDITCVLEIVILGILWIINSEHNVKFHLPGWNLALASLLTIIAFFETIGGFRYLSKIVEKIDKCIVDLENGFLDLIKAPFRFISKKTEPKDA